MAKLAGCLCQGFSVGARVSLLDAAGLDAEIEALARISSMVVARRSLVIAELARRHGDVAERLRESGNMSKHQARKAARTAGGLDRLPKTREALANGEIGAEQAGQLAGRMDKPELARNVREHEDALLEKAKAQNADEFASTMRREDIDGSAGGGKNKERRQRQARKASMWVDDDTGMHLLFAQFDPVTGARISTELAAMTDRLWRAEHLPGAVRSSKRMVDQRRADALEALICRNAGGGAGTANHQPFHQEDSSHEDDGRQPGFNFGPDDGPFDASSRPGPAAVPLPAPNPTQLMVIANLDALRQLLGGGSLPDGTPLSAEAVAKLACDAQLLPAIFDSTGQPLWLGRTQRLATGAQRAAVTARDQGCIVCGTATEWCQVHHINWWSKGGTTDIDNLCLLCSKHHHLVHEHGLTIDTTPDGFKVQTRPTRSSGPPARPSPRTASRPRGRPAAAA